MACSIEKQRRYRWNSGKNSGAAAKILKNNRLNVRLEVLIEESAKKYRDFTMLSEWTGENWTSLHYDTFFEKARDFAQQLKTRNSKPGERVVIISHNQIQALIALVGIWCAKATAVLIDPHLPEDIKQSQLKTADARFLVIEKNSLKNSDKMHFEHIAVMTAETYEWQHHAMSVSQAVFEDMDPAIATLLFTSGTTGDYKAVMLTHDNYLYLNGAYQVVMTPLEKKTAMTVLPFFHISGIVTGFLEPLSVGAHIVFFKHFSVEALREGFLKYPPYFLTAVPKLLEVLNQTIQKTVKNSGFLRSVLFVGLKKIAYFFDRFLNITLGNYFFKKIHDQFGGKLEKIFIGAASLSKESQKDFCAYGFKLIFAYGLTETCGPITYSSPKDKGIFQGVGQCLNIDDLCVDPETKEILYKGPALMKGYFRDPKTTALAIQNGFFHTLDLGILDKHHRLKIIGRLKELIVFSDGKKAMPEQIERHYKKVEGITEMAVFSVLADNTVKAILAIVIEKKDEAEKIKKTLFSLSSRLQSPYRIADVMIVDTLPKSSTLKIKRHQLAGEYRQQESVKEVENDPLLLLFRAFFSDKKNIHAQTPFAELNIDSFCATSLAKTINEKFNLTITPAIFWRVSNIGELREAIFKTDKKSIKKIDHQKPHSKKIAIIGMTGMFPGAQNLDDYWRNMMNGVDSITPIPLSRWDNAKYYDAYGLAPGKTNVAFGGFIDLCSDFNGADFGLKKRVIDEMDPQQKIVLHLTQQLLTDYPLTEALKKSTGFYLGAGFSDYMLYQTQHLPLEKLTPYSGMGMADFSSIGRVAYHFGLEGPALLIKTACSSSLAAVHQAVRALQAGDCKIAIAGGINLLLVPDITVSLSKGGFLSPDGRCKTFDASANGYVRSEGCGLVLLKNYEEAIQDGDKIYGVIAGVGMNQDGASNGISAPNGKAQERCYQMALADAGITADQVDYIEAHGSGTQLGDAIEMHSLQSVYDQHRAHSFYVGAVKSMIGHCEAAAGIAGLLKTIQVLHYQTVPPNLHYHTQNPHISLAHSSIVLPTQSISFEKPCDFAAVSSFGIAGTNVHVILS